MQVVRRVGSSLEPASSQRFEAKYKVTEFRAQAIKTFIAPFVIRDRFAAEDASYPVNSLYLDTPDLALYRSSARGEKNRVKFRLRTYSAAPDAPVFLEIKRRMDQIIRKRRVRLGRETLPGLLSRGDFREEDFGPLGPKELQALSEFSDWIRRFNLRPCASVRYQREAYVGVFGEAVRVTFDRQIACRRCAQYDEGIWKETHAWEAIPERRIVLELKFTDFSPGWVQDLVQRFNLVRESMSKYVISVSTLSRRGYSLAPVQSGRA